MHGKKIVKIKIGKNNVEEDKNFIWFHRIKKKRRKRKKYDDIYFERI